MSRTVARHNGKGHGKWSHTDLGLTPTLVVTGSLIFDKFNLCVLVSSSEVLGKQRHSAHSVRYVCLSCHIIPAPLPNPWSHRHPSSELFQQPPLYTQEPECSSDSLLHFLKPFDGCCTQNKIKILYLTYKPCVT